MYSSLYLGSSKLTDKYVLNFFLSIILHLLNTLFYNLNQKLVQCLLWQLCGFCLVLSYILYLFVEVLTVFIYTSPKFMTITLNSYQVNYLSPLHQVFFLEFYLVLSFEHIPVFLHFASLSVLVG